MTQKIEIFNFLYIFQNDCSLSHTAQGPEHMILKIHLKRLAEETHFSHNPRDLNSYTQKKNNLMSLRKLKTVRPKEKLFRLEV